MNVARKIYPVEIENIETGRIINEVAVVTEFAIGEAEKDKAKLMGGAIVCEYNSYKKLYISKNKLIIVIPGDVQMNIDKYDEDGLKLPRPEIKDKDK
jgi:hypothetical protein